MTACKLKPGELPDWPARMGAILAAAYVDLSESQFRAEVGRGIWPEARYPGGAGGRRGGTRPYWYRVELDAALAEQRDVVQPMTEQDIDREFAKSATG